MTFQLQKLGIIAGGGDLPLRIAESCARRSHPYLLVAVDEFALAVPGHLTSVRLPGGRLGRVFAALRAQGCRDVVFAGKYERPGAHVRLRPDLTWLWLLARNIRLFRRGDDALHRVIAREVERRGFRVVSPLDADPGLAAPAGYLTRARADDEDALAQALDLAKEHGGSDQGQAVVVRDGAIVAREGRAGTDAMLLALPNDARGGVLAKAMKPGQIRNVDPPAIGVSTVEAAAKAGLAGIVVEAGATVVVDAERVRARADELGLFVYGRAAP